MQSAIVVDDSDDGTDDDGMSLHVHRACMFRVLRQFTLLTTRGASLRDDCCAINIAYSISRSGFTHFRTSAPSDAGSLTPCTLTDCDFTHFKPQKQTHTHPLPTSRKYLGDV